MEEVEANFPFFFSEAVKLGQKYYCCPKLCTCGREIPLHESIPVLVSLESLKNVPSMLASVLRPLNTIDRERESIVTES